MQGTGQQERSLDTISRVDKHRDRLGQRVHLNMFKEAFIQVGCA